MEQSKKRKRAQVSREDCVACGCCVKVCPRDAIHVVKGVCAAVDESVCIGCGKCVRECPAGIIALREVPA